MVCYDMQIRTKHTEILHEQEFDEENGNISLTVCTQEQFYFFNQ